MIFAAALSTLTALPAGAIVLHASGVTDVSPVEGAPDRHLSPIGAAGQSRYRTEHAAGRLDRRRRRSGGDSGGPADGRGDRRPCADHPLGSQGRVSCRRGHRRELYRGAGGGGRAGDGPGWFGSEAAHSAVAHLMRTSIAHVAALGPEQGLTGPVARGDVGTIQRNLAALAGDPLVRDLYVSATRIAVELAKAVGTDRERLGEIEQLLHP